MKFTKKYNNVWIGSSPALSYFNGTNWTFYNDIPELGLTYINVYGLAIDSEDNKWIGTLYSGILKFDGSKWLHIDYPEGLVDYESTYRIAIDSHGNKWFNPFMLGVVMFNDTEWILYNKTNGLAGNSINCILMDKKEKAINLKVSKSDLSV